LALILFASPDLDAPGGGVRIIYGMVEALNKVGLDAAVWQGLEGNSSRWFRHDAPVVTGLERRLNPGDVLVMPELGGARYRHLVDEARVVILNQAHFYTMFGARWEQTDPHPYPGWPNAVGAICTSAAIEHYLQALVPSDFPVWPVPVYVANEMFVDSPKKKQVAFMLSRRSADIAGLLTLIRRNPIWPAGWTLSASVVSRAPK